MTINSNWKVLKIDQKNDLIYLVPPEPVNLDGKIQSCVFEGAPGYNNAVNMLNDTCNALYGSGKEGISAKCIDMDFIEELMDEVAYDSNNNILDWKENRTFPDYRTGASTNTTSPYTSQYSFYPLLYALEQDCVINENKNTNGLKRSENAPRLFERTDTVIEKQEDKTISTKTATMGLVHASTNIHPITSYYEYNNYSWNDDFLGKYKDLILLRNNSYYFATRYVWAYESLAQFGIWSYQGGELMIGSLKPSEESPDSQCNRDILPVVKVDAKLINGDTTRGFYIE